MKVIPERWEMDDERINVVAMGHNRSEYRFRCLLWIYNFVVAENNNAGIDPGVEANAILWQTIGASFFGFGVLALLITLSTAAITSAITSSDRD